MRGNPGQLQTESCECTPSPNTLCEHGRPGLAAATRLQPKSMQLNITQAYWTVRRFRESPTQDHQTALGDTRRHGVCLTTDQKVGSSSLSGRAATLRVACGGNPAGCRGTETYRLRNPCVSKGFVIPSFAARASDGRIAYAVCSPNGSIRSKGGVGRPVRQTAVDAFALGTALAGRPTLRGSPGILRTPRVRPGAFSSLINRVAYYPSMQWAASRPLSTKFLAPETGPSTWPLALAALTSCP